MADPDTVASLADQLWEAELTRVPIAPLTDRYADLVIDDAYAIQQHNIDRRIAANNYRQRKALERDWGAMSMRYQQLRG